MKKLFVTLLEVTDSTRLTGRIIETLHDGNDFIAGGEETAPMTMETLAPMAGLETMIHDGYLPVRTAFNQESRSPELSVRS